MILLISATQAVRITVVSHWLLEKQRFSEVIGTYLK
jgi:hypothetical protein